VLRAQLVGGIVSPLTTFVALLAAPLRDLVGLIDARIAQLGDADAPPVAASADAESAIDDDAEEPTTNPQPEAGGSEGNENGN
jgi:hypothetical protein